TEQISEIKKEIYTIKIKELKSELANDIDNLTTVTEDFSSVKRSFIQTKERLKNEITNLMKRGNINLGAGVIITIIAVISLWLSLNDFYIGMKTIDYKNTTEMLTAILPRLSLVLLIEIFAYFFLRLYKIGLEDIKYYQNELTNVESKLIAMEASYITNNPIAMKLAIEELVKTERNFVLKKGETTVELEKAKSESESMKTIINAVPSLFKQKGK
ncbi:MAG: hypothetical protein WA945_11180, partial [Arcobacteraceae bacterium]